MTTSVSMDNSLVRDENALSDYDMALSLLENNPPENRLDVSMSYSQYLQLEESWSQIKSAKGITEDQRYPYLFYNSLFQIATVVTVPRDLHEVAASELRREIMDSIVAYLSLHKPDAIGTIVDSGSVKEKVDDGPYNHSSKQSDGVFKYSSIDGRAIMVAIEVGSSEIYTALCRDKNLWLDGHHVKVCILVCFKESPRFRNPRRPYENIDAREEKRQMTLRVHESCESFGPISYKNHKWLGELKEGFIEVWRHNDTARYPLIERGQQCDPLPTNIGLRMQDFYPPEAWQAANMPDGDILINGTVFMKYIKTAIIETAIGRFSSFVSP
ncbi:hypothetical protein V1525DRAFT_347553 [Lipomyces kononenkoae]|uniref:Uncharacterized protein n=1 Tax=Lipomyces kononenkoae TaxID=34357 RepID=A0ACC3SVY0_LIPKO